MPGSTALAGPFLGRRVLGTGHDSRAARSRLGTDQEVDFLVDAPRTRRRGRASSTPAAGRAGTRSRSPRRGIDVVGVDLSPDFVALASGVGRRRSASPSRVRSRSATCASSRSPPSSTRSICLCQGGFGLLGGGADEGAVLARFARALRPGGRLAVSAFNAYFALRHLEAGDTFDAARGVNHEARVAARTPTAPSASSTSGRRASRRASCGCSQRPPACDVDAVHGVTPGRYARGPAVDRPAGVPARSRTGI